MAELTPQSKLIRETTLRLIQKKQSGKLMTMEQLNELWEGGVITDKSATRYCVKSEYWEMMKSSDISTRSAIIDLSIRWNICEASIKNIIYGTPATKV